MRPGCHINKKKPQGCPKCGKKNTAAKLKMTFEKFIEKANVKFCKLKIQELDIKEKFEKLNKFEKEDKENLPGSLNKIINKELPRQKRIDDI